MKPFTRGRFDQSSARRGHHRCRRRTFLPALERLEDRLAPATLTVNTPLDNNVADSVLTLHEAILVANGNLPVAQLTAGELAQVSGQLTSPAPDTIAFNIPGFGPHSIFLRSELPIVLDPVIIDGYTQPNAARATASSPATLKIVLEEALGVQLFWGLRISAGSSVVRGLVIGEFDNGIELRGNGDNVIEGNHIGTYPAGTASLANGTGILVDSSFNVIGGSTPGARNVISGNNFTGISLVEGPNTVQGNYIGIDAAGVAALPNLRGIDVDSSGNMIGGPIAGNGNVISGNTDSGVRITQNSNTVQGNYIGTDAAGARAVANREGVNIDSSLNLIGGTTPGARNVISGNIWSGIEIRADDNTVEGNYIGIDVAGTGAVGNSHGISVSSSLNLIGGTTAGARNVISGNRHDGIEIRADDNTIQGNYVGTNAAGTGAVGNHIGISVSSSLNLIGGPVAGARNVISGNGGTGISIFLDGNIVQGNYVGTNAAGTGAMGNGKGIDVESSGNLIGGAAAGARNVVSGNRFDGIEIEGDANTVQGNYVGTGAAGGGDLGNGYTGILARASGNWIGGEAVEAGNVIAFNGRSGVKIAAGTANRVLSNRIWENGDVGIDLDHNNGVTPNDADDSDAGANGLQNFPVLSRADNGVNSFTVEGTLTSTATTSFLIQFFASNSAGRATNREGERLLGSTTVTTNAAGPGSGGTASFARTFVGTQVLPGWLVTATATRLGIGASPIETSEFSAAVPVNGTIAGQKFEDLNANGVKNAGEPGLYNWIIYLDANNNRTLDPGERSTTTDIFGNYAFGNLPSGQYIVREVLPAGWVQSTPAWWAGHAHFVTLAAGQVVTGRDFGNYRRGSIEGLVFHDYDTDGVRDAGEPTLPGWTIYLDSDGDNRHDVGEAFATTDAAGTYRFANLLPSTYVVREIVQAGWRQTAPAAGSYTVPLVSGQAAIGRVFGNTPQTPTFIVLLSRTSVSEGAGAGAVTATVIRSGVSTAAALSVGLSSSDMSEARLHATVTIPAGQSSATVLIDAVDDFFIDADQSVLFRAFAAGFLDGTATLLVTDDDP